MSLRERLIKMAKRDREMREAVAQGLSDGDKDLDRKHANELKVIISTLGGWPLISNIGAEAASAAWVIAQHADHDPAFQQSCLDMMQQMPVGEVNTTEVAFLEDRVRVNTGKPQLYGTQFHGTGASFRPRPIEDIEHLEERRAKVGLKPFAEYERELKEI